jgi:hypothetical protein
LQCPYCGFVERIEPSAKQVRERDWDEFWQHHTGEEKTVADQACQVTCQGCGAVVLMQEKLATDKCPYCGTHLENKPESVQAMIAPEGVLPFAVSNRQAIDAFNRWLANRWFAPNSLRNFANLGQLSGVYVPYWTYDAMTYTYYTGERGDDYTVTETYTEADANGQTVTKTRTVTRTRWTSVSGEVQHFFDDVLICASRSLPEHLVGKLPPWDLDRLEGYKPEFLSGFQTERYAVGLKEGFDQARAIMDEEIREMCRRDIGGNHQRLHTVDTQHVGITFKHILLPVWSAPYRHLNKTYQILINGRSGKVVGTRPYSWVKITLFVLAILALLLALYLVFSRLAGENASGRVSIIRVVHGLRPVAFGSKTHAIGWLSALPERSLAARTPPSGSLCRASSADPRTDTRRNANAPTGFHSQGEVPP